MSELTDLEICKRIAEIEGLDIIETDKGVINIIGGDLTMLGAEYQDLTGAAKDYYNSCHLYNPLADDALCFQLLKKYDIDLIAPYRPSNNTKWEAQIFTKGHADAFPIYDESPNKAICLSLIEARKDSNND